MSTSAENDIPRLDQIRVTFGGSEVKHRGAGDGGKCLALLCQSQLLNLLRVGFSSTFQDWLGN